MALGKTIARLRARYIPDINIDGGLSIFLDKYLGSYDQRKKLINDIDGYIGTSKNIISIIDSLVAAVCLDMKKSSTPESDSNLARKAECCKSAIECYVENILKIKAILTVEGDGLSRSEYDALGSDNISYSHIEDFIDDVYEIQNEPALNNHANELKGALDSFRDLPSIWELRRDAFEGHVNGHCFVVGDQGTGKTCGLASKALACQHGPLHVPILILASDIAENVSWFEITKQALGLSGTWDESSLWQALSTYASLRDLKTDSMCIRSKVTFLIDALDEKHTSYFWEDKIHEADAITSLYPRIRFVYSLRPWLVEKFEDNEIGNCCYVIGSGGDVPAYYLFDKYLEHYQIRIEGETQYRYLLSTPNELKLFCNVYRGRILTQSVSTALLKLTAAEIERLEIELEKQLPIVDESSQRKPVHAALSCLSQHFMDSEYIDEFEIEQKLSKFGIRDQTKIAVINLLTRYGILLVKKSQRSLHDAPNLLISPEPTSYMPGSRHLWDYCIAQCLIQSDAQNFKELLTRNQDAAMMYGVLLVESKGMLPSNDIRLIEAVDKDTLRQIDLYALSYADPNTTEKFKPWAMELLHAGRRGFTDAVDGIVARVANYPNHPLGATLLDDYLNCFSSSIERDIVWSLPTPVKKNLDISKISFFEDRYNLSSLPQLDGWEKANQMPLIIAWKLSSLSNLERSHYRRELIRWGMKNPEEFACIFEQFVNCNDPQIREDIFAIAEEIVCQGSLDSAVKKRLCTIAIEAVFKYPDKQGNRDAAIRHYARLLAEHCNRSGLMAIGDIDLCRPPYSFDIEKSPMPISSAACRAEAMCGYGPIHYDLARYVLVDRLASAFKRPQVPSNSNERYIMLEQIMKMSAANAEINEPLEFQGWVISAAYQYLLDHGYDEIIIQGEIMKDGYRMGRIDSLITIAYGKSDHGLRSTVMTIVEKYVWCARNEICGYLADRIPVYEKCLVDKRAQSNTYCSDYRNLLSFDSPLFEAAVMTASNKVQGKTPHFPKAFSCSGYEQLSKEGFKEWINGITEETAFAMLCYSPIDDTNGEVLKGGLESHAIPIAMYSCDWAVNGKNSRIWIHAGAMNYKELEELDLDGLAIFDINENASSFIVSIALSQSVCYIAPTEAFASPQLVENDESELINNSSRVLSRLIPLTGQGVDRLIEKDDYCYFFPSKIAREACQIKRTDGVHYLNNEGETIFEEVCFGLEYRHQYHALFADGEVLQSALRAKGFELVWYATVQRGPNNLVGERLGCDFDFKEKSWLIWKNTSGEFNTIPITAKKL